MIRAVYKIVDGKPILFVYGEHNQEPPVDIHWLPNDFSETVKFEQVEEDEE